MSGSQIGNNDASGLQQFADDVRTCADTLSAMDRLDEVDTRSRLVKLVERLPYCLQTRWRKEAVALRVKEGEYPGIHQFVEFLDAATVEMCDPVFGVKETPKQSKGKGNKNESKAKHSSFAAPEKAAAEIQPAVKQKRPAAESKTNLKEPAIRRREVKCPQCDGAHPIYMCDDFRAMTPQARLQVANEKKLCYNCLKIAIHKPEDCRVDRVCSTGECKLKHSYMLHDALACVPNDQSQVVS